MRTILQPYAKKRGATITIVALSTAAILAMGAITVDMGMLYKMRVDAQRTADAAALAGASAYLEYPAVQARDSAYFRAWRYIAANYVGGRGIDTSGKAAPVIDG